MSVKQKILFVAHDPGGAEGLAPVIHMATAGGYDVKILADGPAHSIWKNKSLSPRSIENRQELIIEIDLFQPDVIVTGTSFHSSLDCFAIEEALMRGIASFSFIDAEMNLKQRFIRKNKEYLPAVLGVISGSVKKEIEEGGWYKGRVSVTGQPHLQTSVLQLKEKRKQTEIKRQIVFISEPVDIDYPENALGYNQFDVANILFAAVKKMTSIELVIKLHPREQKTMWEAWINEHNASDKIKFWSESLDDIIASSQWVCGMHSMALITAALCGCKTIAIQPNHLKMVNPLLRRVDEIQIVQTQDDFIEHINGGDERDCSNEKTIPSLAYELMHQADSRCLKAIEACLK